MVLCYLYHNVEDEGLHNLDFTEVGNKFCMSTRHSMMVAPRLRELVSGQVVKDVMPKMILSSFRL